MSNPIYLEPLIQTKFDPLPYIGEGAMFHAPSH